MSDLLKERLLHKPADKTAVITVVVRENKILLGLRDYVDGPTVWTAPGGSVEGGETLEKAARRETEEETGICDLEFLDYIGEVKAEDRDLLHIFYCQSQSDPQLVEPDKFREWVWYSLKDFAAGKLSNYINEPSRKMIVSHLKQNGMLE